MDQARQQDRSFRMCAAFVAALAVFTLAWVATPAQAQTYQVLYDFSVGGPGPQWPGGSLAQGRDGDLYAFSEYGGTNDDGSIWKTTPSGTVTVIYNLGAPNTENCQSGMTQGTDGNFYGFAYTNCTGDGYVFKLTPSGTLTVLHTFTGSDGSGPEPPLVQYTDGNFYGVTLMGGANGYGTVFKMTPSGKLTTLYSFPPSNPYPTEGLTIGNDGNFYSTTGAPSTYGNNFGTVFKMTPAGVLTVLYTFTGEPDGASPEAGVILGKDGNFYGTTEYGGISDGYFGSGTIFKVTPSGKETILYKFSGSDYSVHPMARLLQATDGNFYGVNSGCNEFGCGNVNTDIFKMTPTGTLTVVEEFPLNNWSNGQYPYWGLTQDTNGTIYGLTQQGGGQVNGGVLFTVNIGAGPFVSLETSSGKVGAKIGILGQGLTKTKSVSFNGKAAKFKASSDTFLTATVPKGATSGFVTVTTSKGKLKSNVKFRVTK